LRGIDLLGDVGKLIFIIPIVFVFVIAVYLVFVVNGNASGN